MTTNTVAVRDESEPCCPGRIPLDYQPLGKTIEVTGMPLYVNDIYITNNGNDNDNKKLNLKTILVNYDIFGFNNYGTFEFCDKLAKDGNFLVIIPDFFRGSPWPVSVSPMEDRSKFMDWINSYTAETIQNDIKLALEYIRTRYYNDTDSSLLSIGLVGFCWGGKVSAIESANPIYKACAILHGSMLNDEHAEKSNCSTLMIDSGTDPDRQSYQGIMSKKSFIFEYYRYYSMEHGWTTRGDKTNPDILVAMNDAYNKTIQFLLNTL